MPSIKQSCNHLAGSASETKQLQTLLEAMRKDNAALRTSVVTLTAKLDVLTAKLNADAGVSDINYATDFASACNPAAATVTA